VPNSTEFYRLQPDCLENEIFSYDFEKMGYKKYKVNATNFFKKILKIDSLFLIIKTTSVPSRFVVISDSSFLKQFRYEEGQIIWTKSKFSIFTPLIIFSFVIILVLFFVWMPIKRKTLTSKRKNNTDFGLVIETNEFNQTELDLLQLLLTHQKTGLEISYITDLVNHDQPSIDTLKKRREILLKELRYKLATKFNLPFEDVLFEKRMETDKRMKLLFLNELVKIKM
jgi:hypothetical protein